MSSHLYETFINTRTCKEVREYHQYIKDEWGLEFSRSPLKCSDGYVMTDLTVMDFNSFNFWSKLKENKDE